MKIFLLQSDDFQSNLTKTEQTLCSFILDNLEEIKDLTITELSDKSFVSPTTIVRFIKKIGFKGYKDFVYTLEKEINDINKMENSDEMMRLKEITLSIDKNELEPFCDLILKSRNIFILGYGASFLSAQILSRNLLKLGITSTHISERSLIPNTPGTLLIVISNSGSTKRVRDIIDIAHRNDLNLLSLTSKDSVLHANSLFSILHEQRFYVHNDLTHEEQLNIILEISYITNFLYNKLKLKKL